MVPQRRFLGLVTNRVSILCPPAHRGGFPKYTCLGLWVAWPVDSSPTGTKQVKVIFWGEGASERGQRENPRRGRKREKEKQGSHEVGLVLTRCGDSNSLPAKS